MEESENLIETIRVIFAIIVGLVMVFLVLLIVYGVVIEPYLLIV